MKGTLLLSSLRPISFPLLESFPVHYWSHFRSTTGAISGPLMEPFPIHYWSWKDLTSGWTQTEVNHLALLFSTLIHGAAELGDLGEWLNDSTQGFPVCQKRMTYSSTLLGLIPAPHVYMHPTRHDGYMLRPCLAEVSLAWELTVEEILAGSVILYCAGYLYISFLKANLSTSRE